MKICIVKFSETLRKIRTEKHITQEELAKELGVTRQSIISIERGRCLPSLPLALSFARIFSMPIEDIFLDEEKEEERKETIKMPYDLAPWSPFREVSSLHEAIDRLFEESKTTPVKNLLPQVDVYEKKGKIIVSAEVPGIKEEDLSVELADDAITISGEKKNEREIKEEDFYRQEVSYGSFSRTVTLPSLIDKEKAEAELKDGQLVIILNKKAKIKPKVTKIKVKKS